MRTAQKQSRHVCMDCPKRLGCGRLVMSQHSASSGGPRSGVDCRRISAEIAVYRVNAVERNSHGCAQWQP